MIARAVGLLVTLLLAAPAVASASADDLTVTRTEQLSPRLVEYGFTTPALSGETNVRILLPPGYEAKPKRRYPVLYLLHGCCDFDVPGSRAWTTHGEAEEATAGLPLIVVMPDGGRGGFYSDWYRNGLGGPPMWQTYHLSQLMPWVDRELRTIGARRGRVIAGLSMGGFGAMHYAALHPGRFVAAASFSGAVDTNEGTETIDALSALDGGGPGSVWGLRPLHEVRWRGANPVDLAENLRGLQLTLRTGNGEPGPFDEPGSGSDPVESGVHEATVNLHNRFDELGISHVYDNYGPGKHTWPYWARSLKQTLPDLMATLRKPPPLPRSVTHTAIAATYSTYGWRVALERDAELEFSRLAGASRSGFALEGSGEATVTTPARFPGPRLSVPVDLSSGEASVKLTCKRTCRVTG